MRKVQDLFLSEQKKLLLTTKPYYSSIL